MDFEKAKTYILDRLKNELNPTLYYHSLSHTKDVFEVCKRLSEYESLEDHERLLLKTAALYHDAGFLLQYDDHEEASCAIATHHLAEYGYNDDDIDQICGMIRATKVPQSPRNKLEMLLCDADLDYLGRDDFYTIGNRLFKELKAINKIEDKQSWNQLQIKFLSIHKYFTSFGRMLREPEKQKRIEELKATIA